ncbi:MAG: flagellar hook-associated protein FlgK [Planctomycetales bacterium]|nr:flagellar hook-associated protein FlgK [Planctomycetales bacterium]
MSLFSSLQLASNALYAQSIGLQVVGQNIANVNTPGYSRAITNFTPAPTQRVGRLLLGLGVEVDSIKQRIDEHLNSRLRGATADRVGSEIQESAYAQLEGMLNELQDNDLSTSLNNFLGAISQVLNQPESVSVRNLAVLQGKTLAVDINRLSSRTHELRDDLNAQTADLAPDVNRLLQRVAELNVQIATTEGGGSVGSDAVGLRDQRNVALEELSQLIEIKTQEQSSGAINVFAGGDFLIFEGTFRQVEILHTQENGLNVAQLQVKETDAPLQAATGKLAGLVDARDNIIGKFLADLDGFAKTLAFEFNKVFSSGQGLSGYTQLTSEQAPSDANVALDHAGLAFTPVNGTFNVLVKNTQTGLTKTTQIKVDLNGLDDDDTTLNSLVAQLEAIDGVSASLDVRGRLVLTADAPNSQFAFGDDTSGVLAALGINTFFSGTDAASLGVNSVVASDPAKFAASRSGIDGDTQNAVQLAQFADRLLDSANGRSITMVYSQMVSEVTQGAAVAKSVATGFRTFETTLKGQQLAVSGVNLDEEAVSMMSYQRAYQASARFISTIDDLLRMLTEL